MRVNLLPENHEKFDPEIFQVTPDWTPERTYNGICTYVGYLREGLIGMDSKPTVLARVGKDFATESEDVIDLGTV